MMTSIPAVAAPGLRRALVEIFCVFVLAGALVTRVAM